MNTRIAPHLSRSLMTMGAALLMASGSLPAAPSAPWGKDYFPNVTLTTEEGKEVRFFDDLIEGKIVVINFIYTSCPDTCPLETAQLVKVQEILGDRLGKDLFFYSITLDPTVDTPAVLKKYKEQYHAKWTFLTGPVEDVWELQKKLGLFLEEIKDGLNNHNVNMIIGNQATGRWMKRSPHENPYVLADQIGNWLDGWKRPPELDSYENAPKLRDLPRGEQLFRTRCSSCHSMTGQDPVPALGPDLLGVTRRREGDWLLNWLRAPDEMLKAGDPIATALFEKYNKLPMPNLRLNKEEAVDLLDYLEGETQRQLDEAKAVWRGDLPRNISRSGLPSIEGVASAGLPVGGPPADAGKPAAPDDVVVVTNAWIREAHPAAKVNSGYLTLVNTGRESVTLTSVHSASVAHIDICEMAKTDDLMKRRKVNEVTIPAGGRVEFKPGGLHLMLKERRNPLAAGEKVEITLKLESGREQTVTFEVAAR